MSVHDFARFVTQSALVPGRDLFGETEAEIRADEEVWTRQFVGSRDMLRMMAQEAAAEYRAGRTKPMEFTAERRLTR